MKSSIVLAVLVSAIVWVALALVFRIIPASNLSGAPLVSLVAALAGGLLAFLVIRKMNASGFLSSVGGRILLSVVFSGVLFVAAGLVYKAASLPPEATVICFPNTSAPPSAEPCKYFKGNSGNSQTCLYLELDKGESLTLHYIGRPATQVDLTAKEKVVGKEKYSAGFPFGTDPSFLHFSIPSEGKIDKTSGRVQADGHFGFNIECKSGTLHPVIDPMIEVPRPPRRLYGLPLPFGFD